MDIADRANKLAPTFSAEAFSAMPAYQDRKSRCRAKGLGSAVAGDRLGGQPPRREKVQVSFRSVLQRDHLGIELATASHISLLQTRGTLARVYAL